MVKFKFNIHLGQIPPSVTLSSLCGYPNFKRGVGSLMMHTLAHAQVLAHTNTLGPKFISFGAPQL